MAEWPEGWETIEFPEHSVSLTAELTREVSEGHVLHGLEVTLLVRACGSDDYLFQLEDGRIAEVHMTFAARPEPPPWPATAIFENLDAWRKALADDR